MTVCVTLEHRFERTPDGLVWTRSNHAYAELRRYLGVFDHVRILARVKDVAVPPPGGLRADGPAVSFCALPYYVGFSQFCRCWKSVQRSAIDAIGETDALILKAPSTISCLLESSLRKQNRPFAMEVIGDPWDLYARGTVRHPLRPLFRQWFTHRTASQCRHACSVAYVSGRILPRRYPASPGAFQTAVSDVLLPTRHIAPEPRRADQFGRPVRLITVGTLEHLYKGTDVLLDAVSICARAGVPLRVVVIGDGRSRPALEAQARSLGIQELVEFRGSVPSGDPVFAALDRSDLFVLPSRLEGMPRALIEAMARALPCIASAVGGIPELLDPEDLVAPGNPEALAQKIAGVVQSPPRMERMSHRCLARARDYAEDRLRAKRCEFLASLLRATEAWTHSVSHSERIVA